ncbi:MAG: hypothetical protein JW924_14225 [Fusobacteriaceae bacterium]|nr:hypothetical protein [Fusobacteriaceae bacterium]
MNKKLILLIAVILLCGVILYCCSNQINEKDKFIGVWLNKEGNKDVEIIKIDDKYSSQEYSYIEPEKKAKLYEDGFISEDGYLLFEEDTRFYGFEYKNENEILKITLFKRDVDSLPSECEKKDSGLLTRE